MHTENSPTPRRYFGVTISSTFADLLTLRAALIKSIKANGLTEVAMENDSAKLLDVIDSSLQMVRDGAAYIGIISKRYGQIPKCPTRNPNNVSITELEFNEALRLNRPILLFIMGKDFLLRESDIEVNRSKRKKLDSFRERAKQMSPDSQVHRVYAEFQNFDEFKDKIGPSIAALNGFLYDSVEPPVPASSRSLPVLGGPVPIPKPPHFYSEPPYIGTHPFLGRQAQLDVLDDWASAADSHAILLFEAIGGSGKSILTWEWITKHATAVRNDWAGRFWYSFYGKGAVMADFCQRALAYITGEPVEQFHKKKSRELAEMLLRHLRAKPWLFVLDGLERILVAYHRLDAAEVRDETVNEPTDLIAHRDPCNAIHPDDDDFLKALSAASPSKILITSRLTPRVLLNPARQPIPGVLRVALPGLRPIDAEALLRSCGITGDSQAIQDYLKRHCDCHPLVTGVLAGLINDYLPARGNFDEWAKDPAHGGELDFSDLDLIQKRNHILNAALTALPEESQQFLSLLAMFGEAIDYKTLLALNAEVSLVTANTDYFDWYEDVTVDHLMLDEEDTPFPASPPRSSYQSVPVPKFNGLSADDLTTIVTDLEVRGLLQYDHQAKRYDLHPVVRGIVASKLDKPDKERVGQRVVDYFSRQAHIPYRDAETLEDLSSGLRIVRTLIQMGHFNRACSRYLGVLCNPLLFNLEAHAELLSIQRPFFPQGWATLPMYLGNANAQHLASDAAQALGRLGQLHEAVEVYNSLIINCLDNHEYETVPKYLSAGIGQVNSITGQTREAERLTMLALDLATLLNSERQVNMRRLDRFTQLSDFGRYEAADAMWNNIDLDVIARYYRRGWAEYRHAVLELYRGTLTDEEIVSSQSAAKQGKDRYTIRSLCALRGQWQLAQEKWQSAADSLAEAVRLARVAGKSDGASELGLKLAHYHLGQLEDPIREVEQLEEIYKSNSQLLAELWIAVGHPDRARKHALLAYKRAWGDGEPYVYRFALNRGIRLLEQIGEPIPDLPLWDPTNEVQFPWEERLYAVMEQLRSTQKRNNVL